jgi:hypothetical protein
MAVKRLIDSAVFVAARSAKLVGIDYAEKFGAA